MLDVLDDEPPVHVPLPPAADDRLSHPAIGVKYAGRAGAAGARTAGLTLPHMPGLSWLSVMIAVGDRHHDGVLRDVVAPLFTVLDTHPERSITFFVRYREHLPLRVGGPAAWIDRAAREIVEAALAAGLACGQTAGHVAAPYAREVERYGGEAGLAIAERLFEADARTCLSLLDAEARGAVTRSRRELSLVATERLLDLFGFDHAQRLEFYRAGYAWALEGGYWETRELGLLEERYQSLRPGLRALLETSTGSAPAEAWGGPEAAAIGSAWLAASRPHVAALRAADAHGGLSQSLTSIAWSLAHMHCNRLRIAGDAEGILRYFMHRLHGDGEVRIA